MRSAAPPLGLCLLAMRRVLPKGLAALVLVLALWLATRDWSPTGTLELLEARGEGAKATARALTRHGVWSCALLILAPLLLLRTASCPRRWRSGECDWLAPRRSGRLGLLFSTWLGSWGAAALALLLVALAAEHGAGSGTQAPRVLDQLQSPGAVLLHPDRPMELELELPTARPEGAELSLALAITPGGAPVAEVRARARSLTDKATHEALVLVDGRTHLRGRPGTALRRRPWVQPQTEVGHRLLRLTSMKAA